jgi:hypothetical protein
MGLDNDVFDIKNWVMTQKYMIRCDVFNKKEKFECAIVVIYGSAYEEYKQEFIDELLHVS